MSSTLGNVGSNRHAIKVLRSAIFIDTKIHTESVGMLGDTSSEQ